MIVTDNLATVLARSTVPSVQKSRKYSSKLRSSVGELRCIPAGWRRLVQAPDDSDGFDGISAPIASQQASFEPAPLDRRLRPEGLPTPPFERAAGSGRFPFAVASVDLRHKDRAERKLPCPRLSRQFAQITAGRVNR